MVALTRPTEVSARRQISVQELVQRVRAENSPPPAEDRVERRVRAAVALEKGGRRPDVLTRWLIAGAGAVTLLSAFAVISFVVSDDPAPAPAVRGPAGPGAITFAGTRTVTETAAPPPPTTFYPPYGSPYGSYYVPAK